MLLLLGSYIRRAILVNIGEGDCRHIGGWQAAEGGVCVRSFLLLKLYSCWFLLHWVFNYHWLLCLIQHRCLCWLFFYTPAPSCVSFSACAHSWTHSTHVSTHARHTRTHKHAEALKKKKKNGLKQTSNSLPLLCWNVVCLTVILGHALLSITPWQKQGAGGQEAADTKTWHCSGGCCCSYLLTKLSSVHDGLQDHNPWCLAWLTTL